MRVALLLYGQPRFVERVDVWRSHLNDIISRYETDVYAQMWYDEKGEYQKLSSWAAEKSRFDYPSIPINAPDIIEKRYNPRALLIQKPLDVTFDPLVINHMENRFKSNQFYSLQNMKNIVSQVSALDNVCKLVYNTNYDYYILARYDATLDRFPKLTDLERGKFYLPHGGHFNDLVHIFTSHFLNGDTNPFTYLPHQITHGVALHNLVEEPIPELYKYHNFKLRYNESHLKRTDMYAHVIRS